MSMRNDGVLCRKGAAIADLDFAGEWLRDLTSG
jgi:hypothetical protein